jgi:nitrite reductase/ring-hydroxylating ferredoxin subunit
MNEEVAHVGALSTFEVGVMRIVQIGRRQIGILRREGDVVHALLNVCPHRGAPVCRGTIGGTMLPSAPGELIYANDGKVLKCPWHGYEFDIETGASLFGIMRGRLRKFPTEVRGGEVFVTIPARAIEKREAGDRT